jgi:hypothetical protein
MLKLTLIAIKETGNNHLKELLQKKYKYIKEELQARAADNQANAPVTNFIGSTTYDMRVRCFY